MQGFGQADYTDFVFDGNCGFGCLASPLWIIGPDLAEGERVGVLRQHAFGVPALKKLSAREYIFCLETNDCFFASFPHYPVLGVFFIRHRIS